ncbi:hypothetical protein [Nonomuraea jabiensis]|uniref:hypothetical protein n=1 Tax=Nonomuraea jabiensis TaxID=882448 RepID=UPI003D70351D
MSRLYAKIAAVLIAMTAAFVAISAGTASTASAYDCRDAIHLYWAAHDGGYSDSATWWLSQIIGHGCI